MGLDNDQLTRIGALTRLELILLQRTGNSEVPRSANTRSLNTLLYELCYILFILFLFNY